MRWEQEGVKVSWWLLMWAGMDRAVPVVNGMGRLSAGGARSDPRNRS